MDMDEALNELLAQKYRVGWDDALEVAAKAFEAKKPGTPLDIVMQGIADEIRNLKRDC